MSLNYQIMMKKIYFFALAVVATMFVACSNETETPMTDTSKLYPAKDATGEYWGYINNKGKFVIQPMFEEATGFSCGYAQVVLGEALQFIDKKGKVQPVMSLDYASDFYYNYATIVLDGNMGLLNTKFDMSIQPFYYNLGLMGDNGLVSALMDDDSKYSYVNAKGETKIAPMYDYADAFNDGLAIVALGGKYGAINKAGEFLIQPTHQNPLLNMGEGLIAYVDKSGKFGIMDAKGNLIVPAMYTNLTSVSDGMIGFWSKTKCGYLNTKGEVVIPDMYFSITPFYEGYAWVKQSEKSTIACINKKNEVVFYLLKDEVPVGGFHNGLALIATQKGYKYIDTKNSIVYSWSPEEMDDIDLYAPKTVQEYENVDELKIMSEMDMTLHFDSRKL